MAGDRLLFLIEAAERYVSTANIGNIRPRARLGCSRLKRASREQDNGNAVRVREEQIAASPWPGDRPFGPEALVRGHLKRVNIIYSKLKTHARETGCRGAMMNF